MAYSTIRAAIKTALEGVAGITAPDGKVIDHEPQVIDDQAYFTNFISGSGTKINAWTITRDRKTEIMQDPGFRFQVIHEIVVRARYGLQESSGSEVVFQDLIDSVCSALRADLTIWVECPEDSENAIQVELIDHEMHGPYLVHIAELRFNVEEFEVITS